MVDVQRGGFGQIICHCHRYKEDMETIRNNGEGGLFKDRQFNRGSKS